jgi:hypothetical protein
MKIQHLLVASLAAQSLCVLAAHASEHIQLDREFLVERDHSSKPYSIAKDEAGNYIIAGGNDYQASAWATSITPDGKLNWRYVPDVAGERALRGEIGAVYRGIAVSRGTILLCGAASPKHSLRALTTLVDGTGKVLDEEQFFPKADAVSAIYTSSQLERCVGTATGFLAVGTTIIKDGSKGATWIVALDANGKPVRDDVIPEARGAIEAFYLTDTADILLAVGRGEGKDAEATKVMYLDPAGKVKTTKDLPKDCQLISELAPGGGDIQCFQIALSGASGYSDSEFRLYQMKATGEVSEVGKVSASHTSATRVFRLPDRSYAFFGNTAERDTPSRAALTWMSADLKTREFYEFEPPYSAFRISDAMFTGAGQQIASVRERKKTYNASGQARETDIGVELSFVTFR